MTALTGASGPSRGITTPRGPDARWPGARISLGTGVQRGSPPPPGGGSRRAGDQGRPCVWPGLRLDLTKMTQLVSEPIVPGDPAGGDLDQPLAVAATDLNRRTFGPQAGGQLQQAGPGASADQSHGRSRNRVG